MADGSNGYRESPGSHQFTPGLISSLPGMAGLPLFISFSTRCAELVSGVLLSSDGSFVFLAPEEFLALTGTINHRNDLHGDVYGIESKEQ